LGQRRCVCITRYTPSRSLYATATIAFFLAATVQRQNFSRSGDFFDLDAPRHIRRSSCCPGRTPHPRTQCLALANWFTSGPTATMATAESCPRPGVGIQRDRPQATWAACHTAPASSVARPTVVARRSDGERPGCARTSTGAATATPLQCLSTSFHPPQIVGGGATKIQRMANTIAKTNWYRLMTRGTRLAVSVSSTSCWRSSRSASCHR